MDPLYASPSERDYGSLETLVGSDINQYVTEIDHADENVTPDCPRIEEAFFEADPAYDIEPSASGMLYDMFEKAANLWRGIENYDVRTDSRQLDVDHGVTRILKDLIPTEDLTRRDAIELYGSSPEKKHEDPRDWPINPTRGEVVDVAVSKGYDEDLRNWPIDRKDVEAQAQNSTSTPLKSEDSIEQTVEDGLEPAV